MFDLIAILLVLTAAFGYVNHRWVKMPFTIGVMALTLIGSLLVLAAGQVYPSLSAPAKAFVEDLDFNDALLHGMLGFLLFAGALQINLGELARATVPVALLASLGITISTAIVGGLTWLLLTWLGLPVRMIWCLTFGALISPTDPVAVLGLLKQVGISKELEMKIAGESLFNDGVGVALFLGLLEIASGETDGGWMHFAGLLSREALGGALFGLVVGWIVFWMMRSIDNYQVEILISLALVAGGYALAEQLGLSAPIAVVVAGVLIGNQGRTFAMSTLTVEHLDQFWEIIDELLNGVLFVLIGLELLILEFTRTYVIAGVCAIAIVLLARLVSVIVPITLLRGWQRFERGTVHVLTWGGLRGGISVAMALSLPRAIGGEPVHERDVILAMTYFVVVFSILVQGLSLRPLVCRWGFHAEGEKC